MRLTIAISKPHNVCTFRGPSAVRHRNVHGLSRSRSIGKQSHRSYLARLWVAWRLAHVKIPALQSSSHRVVAMCCSMARLAARSVWLGDRAISIVPIAFVGDNKAMFACMGKKCSALSALQCVRARERAQQKRLPNANSLCDGILPPITMIRRLDSRNARTWTR